MKLKHLFLAAFAAAGLSLTSCDPNVVPSGDLSISGEAVINISAEGGSASLEFMAGADWKIKGYNDDVKAWLSISPDEGKATNQIVKLTVTALPNEGGKRTANLEVYSDIMHKAAFTVNQAAGAGAGEGTKEKPYSVAEAIAYVSSLAADVQTTDYIYIKGIVSNVKEIDTGSYGNATYYISDNGSTENQFYVFRGYGYGGEKFTAANQLEVGKDITIYTLVVNYKGNTPETVTGKCQIASYDGKDYAVSGGSQGGGSSDKTYGPAAGKGTAAEPFNVAGVQAYTAALAAGVNSTDEVYFTGKVSEIKEIDTGSFGNATYYVVDEGFTGTFYVYRSMSFGGEKFVSGQEIKVGDVVVVKGNVVNYQGNTPETVQGKAQLVSVNGKTSDDSKFVNVSTTSLTVAATTTTATFNIYANEAWTVESSNAAVAVSPASGSGNAEVTLTFSANESSEAVTATITVKSSVGNKTIEFIQKGKSSTDGNDFVLFDATVQKSGNNTAGAQTVTAKTAAGVDVTLAVTNGILGGDTTGQYRIYKGQKLTVSVASGKIAKIEFTCMAEGTAQYGPGSFAAQTGYSYDKKEGVWEGSAASVEFTAESNQVRATLIKVTLEK